MTFSFWARNVNSSIDSDFWGGTIIILSTYYQKKNHLFQHVAGLANILLIELLFLFALLAPSKSTTDMPPFHRHHE